MIIKIIASFLIGYFLASILTIRYYKKKDKLNTKFIDAMQGATAFIAEKIINNNLSIDEMKKDVEKKAMENILRIKLKEEEEIKKINEETLEKLKNL